MLVTQLGASPVPDVNSVKVLHRPHVCQESRNGLVHLSTLRQQSREIAAFFPRRRIFFPELPTTSLCLVQPPIQWTVRVFPGDKAAGASNWPLTSYPFSFEAKHQCSDTCSSSHAPTSIACTEAQSPFFLTGLSVLLSLRIPATWLSVWKAERLAGICKIMELWIKECSLATEIVCWQL